MPEEASKTKKPLPGGKRLHENLSGPLSSPPYRAGVGTGPPTTCGAVVVASSGPIPRPLWMRFRVSESNIQLSVCILENSTLAVNWILEKFPPFPTCRNRVGWRHSKPRLVPDGLAISLVEQAQGEAGLSPAGHPSCRAKSQTTAPNFTANRLQMTFGAESIQARCFS